MSDDLAFVPQNAADLSSWSFANMADHRDINRVIFQTLGINISEYVLDPFDPNNMGNWAWQHQDMHRQAWAALGGAGYDLLGIDWQDTRFMEQWIAAHNDEHNRLNAALGL